MKEGMATRIANCERMPVNFGKYKPKNITFGQLPSSYLKYIAENFDNDDPKCIAADMIWNHREETGAHVDDD